MNKIILITFAILMAACSAKVSSDSPAPDVKKSEVKSTVSCEMNKKFNGQLFDEKWQSTTAIAFPSSFFPSMWDVTVFDGEYKNPCKEFIPSNGLKLYVAKEVGSYDLLDERAAFFYKSEKAITTSNGILHIDQITDEVLYATLEAYSSETLGGCGKLEIIRCDQQ